MVKIGELFEQKWQFPYCLGFIDGKHTKKHSTSRESSVLVKLQTFKNVVLMAIANTNCELIFCKMTLFWDIVLCSLVDID
jgi:hypothetical protein